MKTTIKKGESETVEFKESFDKEAIETAGAFANTSGGIIFIGVNRKGLAKGSVASGDVLKDWANQISQATEPRIIPEIKVEKLDGKEIVVVQIKGCPIKPVMYVKARGKIANKEYQELTGVSKPTATIDLKELIDKGIFNKIGSTGRGTEYTLKA